MKKIFQEDAGVASQPRRIGLNPETFAGAFAAMHGDEMNKPLTCFKETLF